MTTVPKPNGFEPDDDLTWKQRLAIVLAYETPEDAKVSSNSFYADVHPSTARSLAHRGLVKTEMNRFWLTDAGRSEAERLLAWRADNPGWPESHRYRPRFI